MAKLSCFPLSKHWQPYSAFCMTIVQILGMCVATAITRSNGFTASFKMLLGLWSMRPRMSLLTWVYDSYHRHGNIWGTAMERDSPKPFEYTLRDTILTECLLSIFSTYFALKLMQGLDEDAYGCQGRWINSGVDSMDPTMPDWVRPIRIALGFKIFAGGASLFILAGQIIDYLSSNHDIREDFSGTLVFWASLIVTFGNFITSWEIWGVFINNSGPEYCPGGIVGTGVTWGFVLAINALVRPILGGSAAS